jgi:hypothetical protein
MCLDLVAKRHQYACGELNCDKKLKTIGGHKYFEKLTVKKKVVFSSCSSSFVALQVSKNLGCLTYPCPLCEVA